MSVYEQLETAAIQAQRWNNIAVGVTAGLKSPENTCDPSTKEEQLLKALLSEQTGDSDPL